MSFTRFNPEDSVVSSETVVRGLWSGDTPTLNSFFNFGSGSEYYFDVYDTTYLQTQFSIQYGHASGSGSAPINVSIPGYSPSRVVYGQYRNLVYGTETNNFSFDGGSSTSDSIYVINVSRARYKESLLPGSMVLTLSGSAGKLVLGDDSGTTNLTRFIGENKYYNIVPTGSTSPIYGLFFPDLSTIILNANALSGSGGTNFYVTSSRGNTTSNNHFNLYTSIVSGSLFQLNSSETVSARYFFTRVKNSEYNYTTNPSVIDANGNLLYTTLINNPQTYVTTVGMYNDNNELLAVAKLSKPLVKDFTKEALIRIKLDY